MKRIFAAILYITAITQSYALIEQLQQPVFVRLTDSDEPMMFETTRIDSITFSYISVDSIECSTIQTQLIWTKDSVYAVPLSHIKEVSLDLPQKDIRQDVDVVEISDERLKYIPGIISIYDTDYNRFLDSYDIYFDPDCPEELLPKVGQIWIYDGICETFPQGFIGRCVSTTGYSRSMGERRIAYFETADYSDAYSTYYSAYRYSPGEETINEDLISGIEKTRSKEIVSDNEYFLPWYKINLDLEVANKEWIDAPLKISGSTHINNEIGIRYGAHLIVSKLVENDVTFTTVEIYGVDDFSANIDCSLNGTISKDIPITPEVQTPIPAAPGVVVGLSATFDMQLEGKIAVQSPDFGITSYYGLRYTDRSDQDFHLTDIRPSMRVKRSHTHSTIYGEGSLSFGFTVKPNVALLNRRIASMGPKIEAKFRASVNAPISPQVWAESHRATRLYTEFSDDEAFTLDLVGSVGGEATILNAKKSFTCDLIQIPILRKPLLPAFKNLTIRHSSAMEAEATAILQDYTEAQTPLFPSTQNYGFIAYELNDEGELGESPALQSWSPNTDETNSYNSLLTGLDSKKRYRVFAATRPFSSFDVDKIICGAFYDTEVFIQPESKGIFKSAYLAVRKSDENINENMVNGWHYVYELDFPAFDFSEYIDEETEEWGWFSFDFEDYRPYYSEYDIAYEAEYCLNRNFSSNDYGLIYHPLKSKRINATTHDCTYWNSRSEWKGEANIISSTGVIGFYKKLKNRDYDMYKVLYADECPLAHVDRPSISFANFVASPTRKDGDYNGNVDIAFDLIMNGEAALDNALSYTRFYPTGYKHYWADVCGNYAGYIIDDEGFSSGLISGPINESGIDWKKYYLESPKDNSKYWSAYKVKPRVHVTKHNLSRFGDWPNVITLYYTFTDGSRYIYKNHLYLDFELGYSQYGRYSYVRRLKYQIRPNGYPFEYTETVNHLTSFDYTF